MAFLNPSNSMKLMKKTSMAMENGLFEDVSLIQKNPIFQPAMLV